MPSGLSKLKSWVGALSRFGDSHGFYWATVAIAKTAHSKKFDKPSTKLFLNMRGQLHVQLDFEHVTAFCVPF